MQNKYFYLIFALLLIISSSSASAVEWDTFWSDNFLRTVPLIGPAIANSPDRTLMQFYPVENWEVEVCTRDVTSMKSRTERSGNTDEPRVWYDGASVALSASYYTYKFTGETLYDVDWYIEPRDNKIKYSVYFRNDQGDNTKFFIPGYINITTDSGASTGAFSKYYNKTYNVVGISYITINELGEELSREYLETDISPSEGTYE